MINNIESHLNFEVWRFELITTVAAPADWRPLHCQGSTVCQAVPERESFSVSALSLQAPAIWVLPRHRHVSDMSPTCEDF